MIGEVGLDRWVVRDEAELEVQRVVFGQMIALGRELDLPLNVHSRSAGHHAIEQLLAAGATRVLLHAFDGRAQAAMPAVEAGYFFSVPPSVVRSRQKQKLVRRLPLGCLLVETDSPVLGPAHEERNEPKNARISLEAIAALKELRFEQVQTAVEENTRRLLGELAVP
jgi:TatD DNase family protein